MAKSSKALATYRTASRRARRAEHRVHQRGEAHTFLEHGSRDFVTVDEPKDRYEGRDSVRVL